MFFGVDRWQDEESFEAPLLPSVKMAGVEDLVKETVRPCHRTAILKLISRSDGPVRDDLV